MTYRTGARMLLAALLLGAAVFAGTLSAVAVKQDASPFDKRDPWMPEWMMEPGGPGPMSPTMMARMARHSEFLNFGVPKAYEGAQSTVKDEAAAIAAGRALYAANCAACHGPNGLGDGDAGKALSPSPAVLAFMITRPIAVDPYLLWSISEGGKQFDSNMPSFKDKLSREDIWKIIAYMRAGFPGPDLGDAAALAAEHRRRRTWFASSASTTSRCGSATIVRSKALLRQAHAVSRVQGARRVSPTTMGWTNGKTRLWIGQADAEGRKHKHRIGDIGLHHYAFELGAARTSTTCRPS